MGAAEIPWTFRRVRKVHLDFHTPPFVRAIGNQFDPRQFADTLVQARVDTVVLVSKCHYGLSYYETEVGTQHPGLDFDLLGGQLEVCHQRDIKVWAYHSVAWDWTAWEANPDWRQTLASGEPADRILGFQTHWKSVCLNSPYVPELLWKQVRELLLNYDVDGLWFDIVFFMDNACYCRYCRQGLETERLNPADAQEHERFNELSVERFLRDTTAFVKAIRPDVQVTYNNLVRIGAKAALPYVDICEIEAVPHGWGFLYFPLYARYLQRSEKPMNGIIVRFLKSWGDFGSLKSTVQLQYEAAVMLATGATCSIGDQLEPPAKLLPPVYEAIGEAYRFVQEREEYCLGSQGVPNVAILAAKQPGYHGIGQPTPSLWGAAKALLESQCQFDVIDREDSFSPYQAIILVDHEEMSPGTAWKIREYVATGGNLIATYLSGLLHRPEEGEAGPLEQVLGVSYGGLSPYNHGYLAITDPVLGAGIPPMDLVVYDRFAKLRLQGAGRSLAKMKRPLTEVAPPRTYSHVHAPADPEDNGWHDAIVLNTYGDGKAIYIAAPLFKTFYETNNPVYRRLLKNALDILLGEKRVLVVEAPPSVWASLRQQGNRLVLHLLNYHAEQRGGGQEVIEDIPVRRNIPVKVRKLRDVSRVYLAPSGQELAYQEEGSYVSFVVPELHIHQIIVVE